MIVRTESGAVYELRGNQVRRYNPTHVKRGDDEWQTLVNEPWPEVGERMYLVMESLAAYGPDDHGTPPDRVDKYTRRTTTPVIRIEQANVV